MNSNNILFLTKIILIIIYIKYIFFNNLGENFENKNLSSKDEFDEQYVKLYNFLFNIQDINNSIVDKINKDLLLNIVNKSTISILDAGCGSGAHTDLFYKKGYNITGVDRSKTMIQFAEFNNILIRYVLGDICYLNIFEENNFTHIILNTECFYSNSLIDMKKILFNVYKWLKKDGLLIFFLINNKNLDASPRDYSQYYTDNKSNIHAFTYFKGFSHNTWFMTDPNRKFGYNLHQKFIIENTKNSRNIITKFTIPDREYTIKLLNNSGFEYYKIIDLNDINEFEILIFRKKKM